MMLYRAIGLALMGVSVGAAAQQSPQPQQPAPAIQSPAIQKAPNPDDKISCRVSKDGNALKRTCMTRAQWRKFDSDSESGDVDESGLRNPRCPLGAC